MAIILKEQSKCALCGKILQENEEIIGFPAFLSSNHRLSNFSDSAFHLTCFKNDTNCVEVEKLYERYQKIWNSRPKSLKTLEEIEAWGKHAFKDF